MRRIRCVSDRSPRHPSGLDNTCYTKKRTENNKRQPKTQKNVGREDAGNADTYMNVVVFFVSRPPCYLSHILKEIATCSLRGSCFY